MKNYNTSAKIFSYQLPECSPNLINQEITKLFFKSEPMKDLIKEDVCILDIFSSGRNIYDAIPRNLSCDYISLDVNSDSRFKEDNRVVCIEDSDINKIKLDDAICDIIFAPASKIAYGKYHASMFEIERIIKPKGYLICSQSKFWFNRQHNQLLFCSRGWDIASVVEINYLFKNGNDEHPTSQYEIIYRKQ